MSKHYTAQEARQMMEGVTPGPWRWYWNQGIISLEGSDIMTVATDLNVNDSDLIAAAPDLAATVIAQAEQIKRLQAGLREVNEWGLTYVPATGHLEASGIITAEDMEGTDE